jgi:hypothetical protein
VTQHRIPIPAEYHNQPEEIGRRVKAMEQRLHDEGWYGDVVLDLVDDEHIDLVYVPTLEARLRNGK